MTLACSTGAFYVGAVHRTNQKSYANQIAPEEGSQGRLPAPHTHDSSLGSDLSVYLQPELRVSSRTAGSSARWVSADLDQRMTTAHTTAVSTAFDAFDTQYVQVSNEKSQDGGANLTHLTHLTSNRRGCTWRAGARPRPRPLGLIDTPPSVGVKSVKSVKSPTQSCDSSFTFGVKPGVNLTPSAVSGWYNE